MGKWLIGCGVLLALVIGLLAAVFFVVKNEVQEFSEAADEAGVKLETVEKDYPFTKPEDGVLSEDRFILFLSGREKLDAFVEERVKNLQNAGFIAAVRSIASAAQDFMPAFANVLAEIGMSPYEYSFIAREVSYCVQYSRRDEVLAEFPQMASLHGMGSDEPGGEEDEDDPFAAIQASSRSGGGLSAIATIDPYRLTVPRRNIEIVSRYTLRLSQTMGAAVVEELLLPVYHEVAAELGEAAPDDAGTDAADAGTDAAEGAQAEGGGEAGRAGN